MKKKYQELKKNHPEAIILLRNGEWYHTFDDDAKNASQALGITLTKKDNEYQASFPYNHLDYYLPRLIRKGFRVAICDEI